MEDPEGFEKELKQLKESVWIKATLIYGDYLKDKYSKRIPQSLKLSDYMDQHDFWNDLKSSASELVEFMLKHGLISKRELDEKGIEHLVMFEIDEAFEFVIKEHGGILMEFAMIDRQEHNEKVAKYRSLIKKKLPVSKKPKIPVVKDTSISGITDMPQITAGDTNIRDQYPSLFAENLEDIQDNYQEPMRDNYQDVLCDVFDFIDSHIDTIDTFQHPIIHRDLAPITEPVPDIELDFNRPPPQVISSPVFAKAGDSMDYNSMYMFDYNPRRQFTPYVNAFSQFEPLNNEPERPPPIEEPEREIDYENPVPIRPIPESYGGRKFDIFPRRGPPRRNPMGGGGGGGGNPFDNNPLLHNGAEPPRQPPNVNVDWKMAGPIMLASYLVNRKLYGLITNNLSAFIKKLQRSNNNGSYISKLLNWLSTQIDIAKNGANKPRAINVVSKRIREVIDGLSKYSTEHFDDYPREIAPALENLNKTIIQKNTPILYPTPTPTPAPTPISALAPTPEPEQIPNQLASIPTKEETYNNDYQYTQGFWFGYPSFGNSPYASSSGGETIAPPPLVVYYPVKKRNAKIHRRRVI